MPDDTADNIPNTDENADAPPADNDNNWLQTTRPVDHSVETLLPLYAEWCRRIMHQTALSQKAPAPPPEFLQAIIPRAIRHVRRIARREGSAAAIDVMNFDGTSPLHWVMWKVRREWEEGRGAADGEEEDDRVDVELEREVGFVWLR